MPALPLLRRVPRGRPRGAVATCVAALVLSAAAPLTTAAAAPSAVNVSAPGPVTGLSCSPSCDLFAKAGTDTVGGVALPVWNFTNGDATVTGSNPVIVATAGDTLTITVHNTLPVPVALSVPGLSQVAPDYAGTPAGSVAAPGTRTYTMTVSRPGTYLYQAGHLGGDDPGPREAAMGLAGALVVRPAGLPGQALAGSAPASGFDDEAVLVLSEIDPLFAAHPLTYDLRLFHGTYRLVNGAAFPQTQQVGSAPGHRVLLRYVNAGVSAAAIGPVSGTQSVVALNGYPGTGARLVADTVAAGSTEDAIVTMPPAGGAVVVADSSGGLETNGQVDATTLAPATTTPTRQLAFGGRMLILSSSASGVGGVPVGVTTTDSVGPDASAVSTSPNPTLVTAPLTVRATFTDPVVNAVPASPVVAAEVFVDALGAVGTGTPFTIPAPATTVTGVTAVLAPTVLQALTGGPTHTVYVRGKDAVGNWGPASTATFSIPSGGPAVTGLRLTPATSNGTGPVVLSATGDDTAVGSTVSTMDFAVDGSCPSPATATDPTPCRMSLNNPAATVVAGTATLPASVLAALQEGNRVVTVRATDALGLTGSATVSLVLDTHGPTVTTSPTLDPAGPNNGTLGSAVDPSSIRVQAAFTDTLSGGVGSRVVGAEGFLDVQGPNGTGFVLLAADGTFDAAAPAAETAYGLIPLSELTGLADGRHTVYLHARDAAGNWGPAASVVLTVDRTRPVVSAVTATQVPGVARRVSLAATVTNPAASSTLPPSTPGSAIVAAEWFLGTTDPGEGNGTAVTGFAVPAPAYPSSSGPITVTAGNVPLGQQTLQLRVRDAAGNWSVPASAGLRVVTEPLFADTFGTSGTSWAGSPWTLSGAPVRVTTSAVTGALDGSRAMQTSGSAANAPSFVTTPVLTPGSAGNPPTGRYLARFMFTRGTLAPGAGSVTLLSLRSGGTERAGVRFRISAGSPQLGLSVAGVNGGVPASWVTLPRTAANAATTIRIDWTAAGTVRLLVDPSPATATLVAAATSVGPGQTVDRMALGEVTGSAGSAYFDNVTASRLALP